MPEEPSSTEVTTEAGTQILEESPASIPLRFATIDRLIAFLGEPEAIALSNPESPSETGPSSITLEEALRYAHGEALPYLAHFSIPTDRVPLLVEQSICRIARRFLDRIRPRDFVTKEYDRAIEQLKAIAAGRMLLVFEDGNPVPRKGESSDSTGSSRKSTLLSFDVPPSRFASKIQGYGDYDGDYS